MVGVQGHHARRATRGAAALDGGSGAVAHLEEGQEPRGDTAAGKRLAGGAQLGVVRARSRSVLEQARLPGDEVHDAALVHQVVLDGEDETVVHDDAVGKVLAAQGLDVIDLLKPGELEAEHGLLANRGDASREELGARTASFACFSWKRTQHAAAPFPASWDW